jgi:hypothetical protein
VSSDRDGGAVARTQAIPKLEGCRIRRVASDVAAAVDRKVTGRTAEESNGRLHILVSHISPSAGLTASIKGGSGEEHDRVTTWSVRRRFSRTKAVLDTFISSGAFFGMASMPREQAMQSSAPIQRR